MNESKIIVSFKKDVDLSNPDDWIAIDVNESNVMVVSSNPHILRVENDRDVTACLNMLRMRGAPLPLKAICETSKAEVERIVIKC
ncbi:MAG: hypothetical protein ACKD6O_07920 [Candidatus Bathyarchaeota archaeon]